MNKSQRIYLDANTTETDKHIKIQLEQDVDTLKFLSININTADAYQNFNADYGVLVGRVIANDGIGVPNVKISIFMPLTDDDSEDGQIVSIYPYKTPRDKNNEGKRYNLLPRVGKIDPVTEMSSPKQPFGSFPIKEEVVTNELLLNVYKKYYKYTALTNHAGDYMIFGVPIGTQTVHMSVDITDIGEYSMIPAAMVTNLGYSSNLFTDNNTKIKESNDLNDLPHIETQEITVDIIPFWGDNENFEIGITRQDFRIRSKITNTFVVFGSAFTDGHNCMWGTHYLSNAHICEMFRAATNVYHILSKRIGKITEKIFYYPPEITDDDINTGNVDPFGNDMKLLDSSEYSVYKRNGDFVFIITCNRNKIITDDLGNPVEVDYTSIQGVFTKFRGFITFEITSEEIPMNFSDNIDTGTIVEPFRYKLKFPQYAPLGHTFLQPPDEGEMLYTIEWRKQHFIFEANKFYSISRFHPLTYNDNTANDQNTVSGHFQFTEINNLTKDRNNDVGLIITENYNEFNDNETYEFPSNGKDDNISAFGANWLNLTLYLPQLGRLIAGGDKINYIRSADHFTLQRTSSTDEYNNRYYFNDNTQPIAAGQSNTKFFARSDLNWTDFIEVPVTDIRAMNSYVIDNKKGFMDTQIAGYTLIGNYRNGINKPDGWTEACPFDGGKINGNPLNNPDERIYFYKGFGDANCIGYLFELGLVN